MSKPTDQQLAANYMGAVAHLLGGGPGRHAEFIDKVELILSGSPSHVLQLMQFTERCRETGRPTLWFHHTAEAPHVPDIGLVVNINGQARIFENCMLFMGPRDTRACLIPDSFSYGAYRFDDALRLRHVHKAPARTFTAGEAGMSRAYRRLREIERQQRERGEQFRMPELAKAA